MAQKLMNVPNINGWVLTETLHIYLRVSSETQSADGFGLVVQKEWGENLSGILGFTPKIHDEGAASSSNDSLEKRPVLLSLLDQMDREEIKHLYVYNWPIIQKPANLGSNQDKNINK